MTETTQCLPATEMQTLVQQLKMVGATVNLEPIVQVTLTFETGEAVGIRGTAIQDLTLVPNRARPDGVSLAGFHLQLAMTELADAITARLAKAADLTRLTVVTNHQTVTYAISWSPLSSAQTGNLTQFCLTTPTTLTLAAKLPRFYDWPAVLTAALSDDHLVTMAKTLATAELTEGWAALDYLTYLRHLIKTMQRYSAAAVTKSYLLVRYSPTAVDGETWDPVIFDPADAGEGDHFFAGIEFLSYPELLAMPVRVETTGPFWEGMAWLFWEISFNGIEEADRRAASQELTTAMSECQAFEQESKKLAAFLEAYAQTHPIEAHLKTTIAKYWPLTTGQLLNQDDYPTGSMVQRRDSKLWAAFQAQFGKAYQAFDDPTVN